MRPFEHIRPLVLHRVLVPRKGVYALYLSRSEIEYDINYNLWLQSQTQEQQGQNLDIFELSRADEPWLTRQIETALANFRQSVAWATKGSSRLHSATDEVEDNREEYQIVMQLDEPWRGSIDHVCNCLHQYVVSYCLASRYKNLGLQSPASVSEAEAGTWLRKAHHEVDSYIIPQPIFRL